MKSDNIEISILEDGTIKIVTDPVSQTNHVNAEALLREMSSLAGGETTRQKRPDKHVHGSHEHGQHTHQH